MDEATQDKVEALQAVLRVRSAIEEACNVGLISEDDRDKAYKALNDATHKKMQEAIKALGGE